MTDVFDNFDAVIGRLTEKQQYVLGCVAINDDGCHHPATLKKLERLGLIIGRDEHLGGRFPMTIRRYEMPLPIHIRWCDWCSRHPETWEIAERDQ